MSYYVSHSMSDDGRDIDTESDDEDGGGQLSQQVDKRAHHNALERKRRDHIKDSFTGLRDSVPSLQGEKASRAQILKKSADYIKFMIRKNAAHQQDIEDLKWQNELLQKQIRALEKTKAFGAGKTRDEANQEDYEGPDRENGRGKRANENMKASF